MTVRRWRRAPQIWRSYGGENERHATWLELFFDLVFVLAVAELGGLLHDDTSLNGFLGFLLLFVPVWSAWASYSYYADQFDTDDVFERVLILVAMFITVALAVNVHNALDGNSAGFAASYVILRLLLIGLLIQACVAVPEARPLTLRYVGGFAISVVLWAGSILVPEPARYGVWVVALVIELVTWVVANVTSPSIPAQVSHMPERFGLFTIIVLGEAIVVVGAGIVDTDWQIRAVVAAAAGFTLAACMWWLYFDHLDESVIEEALTGGRVEIVRSHVWGYAHLFVFAAITAASVGIELAITHVGDTSLDTGARVALCGGLAVYLLAVTAVQWATPHSLPDQMIIARLIATAVILGLAIIGGVLSPVILTVIAMFVVVALTFTELWRATQSTDAAPFTVGE
jgi:low temperature requirement protein LtrA